MSAETGGQQGTEVGPSNPHVAVPVDQSVIACGPPTGPPPVGQLPAAPPGGPLPPGMLFIKSDGAAYTLLKR